MNSQIYWYVARGSGIVAWGIMAFSVFWGLALSSRFLGKRPKPNWMLDLHRFLGGLSVVFVGVHIASLMLDSYVSFNWIDIVVPSASDYQPAAVAWGVIGMYLLLAVEVSSLLRKRLSKRVWRLTHFLSFPLFAASTAHLLMVGTDRSTLLLRSTVLATVTAITIATLIRIVQADHRDAATSRVPHANDPRLARVPNRQGI